MNSDINELNSGAQQDLNYQQNFEFNNKGNEGPRGNETTRGNEFINQNHEQNTRSDLLPRKRLRTHAHTSTTSGLASKIATVGTLAVGGIIATGALMVDVVKDYDVGDNYIVYELDFNQINAPEFEIYIEDSETDEPILDSMKTVFKLNLGEDASYKDSYFGLEPDHKYYLMIDKIIFETPEGADPTGSPQDPIRVKENIKRFAFKTTYNKPVLEIQSLKVGEYFSSEIFVLAEVIYSDLYEWIANPYLHYEITDYQGNKLEHYGQSEEQKIAITEYGLLSIPIIFYSEENVIISCYLSYEYRGREVTTEPVRLKVEMPPILYAYYEQNDGIYIYVYRNVNNEDLFLIVKDLEANKVIKDVSINKYLQKNPDLDYQIYFIGDLSLEKDVPYVFEVYGKRVYSHSEFIVYDKPSIRIEEMILEGAHQNYTNILVDVFNYDYSGLITDAYLHYEIIDFQGNVIENYTHEPMVPITELGLHTIPLELYLEQNSHIDCYVTYYLDGEEITTSRMRLTVYIGPTLEVYYLSGLGLVVEVWENPNRDPLSIEIFDQTGLTVKKCSLSPYLKEDSGSNALEYYLIDDLDLVDGDIYYFDIYGRHRFYSGEFEFIGRPSLGVVDLAVEEVYSSEVMVAVDIKYTDDYNLVSSARLKYYAKDALGNMIDVGFPGSAQEIELTEKGAQTQQIYLMVSENLTLYCYIEYLVIDQTFTTEEVSLEILQSPLVSSYFDGENYGILIEVYENPNNEDLRIEIKDLSDNVVRDSSFDSYLTTEIPSNASEVYLINDLDLAEGEVYVYRIYGRYTYAFSEFTYFSRPYIAIKTIEGNWVNESEITITVNLNYVDHSNQIEFPYLIYGATDLDGNPIDIALPGSTPEVAIDTGSESVSFNLSLEQNAILYCFITYTLDNEEIVSERASYNIYPRPIIASSYSVSKGLEVEVFRNLSNEEFFIDLRDTEGNIAGAGSLRPYLEQGYQGNALEYYLLDNLDLEEGKTYIYKIYGSEDYNFGEFTFYKKPSLAINSVVIEEYEFGMTHGVAKVNYQDPYALATNVKLVYEATDFDGNSIEVHPSGSSPEIAITERGLQDVALMLDITVNTKLYCYLTYIVDDTHIETEKVTVEVYLSPITESGFRVDTGLEVYVFENPNQDELSVEITNSLDQTVWNQNITSYLVQGEQGHNMEIYRIGNLNLVSGETYNYRIYGRYTYYRGEFTFRNAPILGITSLQANEYDNGNLLIDAVISYLDIDNLITSASLKYRATDLEGNPLDVYPSGSTPEVPFTSLGAQTLNFNINLIVDTKLYCYLEYVIDNMTYNTDEVLVDIYLPPVVESGYRVDKGIEIYVFENPQQDSLSVKITNSLDQTVWDQNIASYLQPQEEPHAQFEYYLINDLNLTSGETYEYTIYDRYTYYRREFTYYKAPSIAISSLTAGELSSDLSISVAVSYQDSENVVTSATFRYYATDFNGNQIEVTLPGFQPEMPFTHLDSQTFNFGISLTQNTKLHCYVEYVVGGNSYFTEEAVLDIYLPPAMEVHYEVVDGFIIEVFENPEATELFLEITNSQLEIVRNGSVSSYRTTTYPSSANEVYQINDLDLTSRETYFYRIYGDYTYRRGNFEFLEKPKITIEEVKPVVYTPSGTNVDVKVNYVDESGNYISNAYLHYYATDLEGNPVSIGAPSSSIAITSLGVQTITLTLNIEQNIKLYCYVRYEISSETITTAEVETLINTKPNMEAYYTIMDGIKVLIFGNPNQEVFSVEIYDITSEQVVWDQNISSYLTPNPGGDTDEYYVINDLDLTEGRVYMYKVYGTYAFYEGEFTFYKPPTAQVNSITASEYAGGEVRVLIEINYVDTYNVALNPVLKFYGTDFDGSPVDLGAVASSIPIEGQGVQTITLSLGLSANIKLYCYIEYNVESSAYQSSHVMGEIYLPAILECWMNGLELVVLEINNPRSEELFIEIKDINGNVVRSGSIASYYVPNYLDQQGAYVINDLNLELEQDYTYIIYGSYIYYRSDFYYGV